MKNYNLYGVRTDLASENKNNEQILLYSNVDKSINVYKSDDEKYFYRTIKFLNLNDSNTLKSFLIKELNFFIKQLVTKNKYHAFIIGIGNEFNTADSIGPKVLKNICVNSHLENLDIPINGNKVSALEPGVLGTTGIDTKKIIESVSKEIHPDFLILIDSYVTENIKYLNKTIQITNEGIIPGSGLYFHNEEISKKTMGIPVIVIGIPTAIEIEIDSKSYIVSTKDIDSYVLEISKIISEAINETLN